MLLFSQGIYTALLYEPLPLSTSAILTPAKLMQATMVYTGSTLPAVARQSKSRYRMQTRYCPSTLSLVCQQTCNVPHICICPKERIWFFDAESSFCKLSVVVPVTACVAMDATHTIRKHQSILQKPGLLQCRFHPLVVGSSIDVRGCLA